MATSRLNHTLRVALAQINTKVGDLSGNADKIIANIAQAREQGADVAVFPELAVTGYPPEDLLLKRSFIEDNVTSLNRIAAETKGITVIIGFVDSNSDIYNAAAILHDGSVAGVQHKFFLPNYGVFDEDRYFQSGTKTEVYKLGHIVFGVEVCEDVWYADGPHSLQSLLGGAHIVFDINSSPFHAGKWKFRETMITTRAVDNSCAIVYLNAVGGQDDLVFDGHSLVVGPTGDVLFRAKAFEEQLAVIDIDLAPVEHVRLVDPRRRKIKLAASDMADVPVVDLTPRNDELPKPDICKVRSAEPLGKVEEVYAALVLGTRDYVNKNGFKEVILGMSGGIDSALTACVAVDALGADRVRALIMPSEFSSEATQSDAELISRNLGIRYDRIPIGGVMEGGTVSEVIASNNPGFAKGDVVLSRAGWQTHALSDGKGLAKIDPKIAPISTAVGVLGMPGMTAYTGLLEIGKPKAGETVVVAAASGAVGSAVGQIAKIKGARAIGIAGGEKSREKRLVVEGITRKEVEESLRVT